MANEVITNKFVDRDLRGYIIGIELSTNRRRTFRFDGRGAALWANARYQRRQAINPADITVTHTVER
jgi:hypothetical protein